MTNTTRCFVALLVAAVVLADCSVDAADAAPPTLATVRRKLDEAQGLVDDGRPAKAEKLLVEAAADLASLMEQDRAPAGVRPLLERCSRLKEDLDLEGLDVSSIEIPRPKDKPPAPTKPAPASRERQAAGVSFTRQVAPLLVTHCGGCHVTGRKGGFQMASYDALMKTGVVQRGVGDASRIVEVIQTGDMPRGGGRVAPQELAMLTAWINAGAGFDGPDPTAPLGQPAPRGNAAPMAAGADNPMDDARPVALKPGEISFAFDVAPVLLKNCAGCHDDDQPEARLSMATFARFSRGGMNGPPFIAGRGADSLLVRKLKGSGGIEGQRMPIGKPPLPADTVAVVEKWIDQGARIDLLGPNAGLADVAAAGRARSLSHEDLERARFAAAERLWRRAIPDEEPAKAELDDVIVICNMPQSRLDEAAGAIQKAEAGVRKQLVAGDGPLLKGGLGLLLFAKPYDYSNFREAVLREDRPKGLVGHAGVSGDVVYGAAIVPAATTEGGDEDLAALAAEQITAAAFIGRGAPVWFARGAGRAVAAKVAPKAPVVKTWRAEAADALGRLADHEDFFGGHTGPVAQAAIGAGFVTALAPAPAKLQAMVEKLDGGASFDAAFADVFKSPPQPLFDAWCAKESRKPARR